MRTATGQKGASVDAAFAAILLIVLVDGLSMGIILPVLPALVAQLAPGAATHLARTLGLLAVVWAVANFLAAPLLGLLSDRIGRKPVILVSAAALAVDLVIMALAPSLAWLLAGRALSGVCAATVASAFAYTTDISPPGARVARFGWINAAYAAGLALGPAIGGVLGAWHVRLPFWSAAVLLAGGVVFALAVLPRPARGDAEQARENAPGLRRALLMLGGAGLRPLAAIYLLAQLAVQAANVLLVFYVMEKFGWPIDRIGLVLTAYALGSGAVLVWLAPALARRLGERHTLRLGLAFAALGCMGLGLAQGIGAFIASGALACLGGVLVPALQSLLAGQAGEHEQGSLQGGLGALTALAAMAGPLLFTQVYAWSSQALTGALASGAAFLAAAAMLAFALTLVPPRAD